MPAPLFCPFLMIWCSGDPVGVDITAVSASVALAKSLASSQGCDRDLIPNRLQERAVAFRAVISGTQPNSDFTDAPHVVLQAWDRHRADRLPAFVRSADGDFDRFINSLLDERKPGSDPFKEVSEVGHAFNRFLGSRPMFRTLGAEKQGGRARFTPFDDFRDYLDQVKPMRIDEAFWQTRVTGQSWLVRTDRVLTKYVINSMVLCHGDVDIQECGNSIIIAGGDARITQSGAAIVFASGDVTLKMGAVNVLVIAGGSVTYGQPTRDLLVVTPKKAEPSKKGYQRNVVVLSGSDKPDPELFTFPQLSDYGIDAEFNQGRVHIRKVAPKSVLNGHLKNDDRVTAAMGKKLESIGQFRRLVSLALDRGKLTCEVERGEATISVSAEIKKR